METGDWVNAAKWAWKVLHQLYACMSIHDCGSHSFLSTSIWPGKDRRAADAPAVFLHKEQFEEMFSIFGK